MVGKISVLKKSTPLLILWLIFNFQSFAQSNQIPFTSIPKSGTILVNAHMDDDMLWMLPFWNITEKFINGAMPSTPDFKSIIHDQQNLLNGYNINYESNWIMPWGEITDAQYTSYYWGNNSSLSYLANDHLVAYWDNADTALVRREVNKIKAKLEQYIASPSVSRIITHNNWGEYGHQQHKALNTAVRELAVKYQKDVWMLAKNNYDATDPSIPYSITNFDLADLFVAIRDIYNVYGRWTWIADWVPSGDQKYLKIVDAGIDRSNILTGQTVTYTGPSQDVPGAYIFDGADDYMTLQGNNYPSFSIAMRIRPAQIQNMDISKMAEYPSSSNFNRSFYMLSDGRITAHVFTSATSSVSVTSKTRLVAGNWSHILMTDNGSWLKLYINGVVEDSIMTSSSFVPFDSPEFVLGQNQETSKFYKGQINDVRFFNYALSETEINSLFGSTQPSSFTISASAGTGGTIAPSGVSTLSRGVTQTYTISADNGYFISDVSVDNSSVGAVTNYTFSNVRANHTIVAAFLPLSSLNLALNKPATSQSNEVSFVASKANDADGTNNSYWAATPYPQWWKVDLGNIYDLSSVVIRNYADNNRYYHYTIEASVDDILYTTIATKNNSSKATNAGDTYSVNATARYIRVTMTSNTANNGVHISDFRAYGTLNNNTFYNITSSAGTNGSINPAGTVKKVEKSSQSYDIIPDYGYQVSDVKVDGISRGALSAFGFNNIIDNHTIAATFSPVFYSITASSGTNGSISPSGSASVIMGTDATYTITPNAGYKISDVKVDNISVGAVSSYTFSNITENHTISATFATLTYTITGTSGTGGTISPAGIVTLNYGTGQTYNITANTGYQISDVKIDNVSVGAVSTYTFNNVRANHTIAATFSHITFNITASAGTGGNISPAGIVTNNYGANQSYNIVPGTGYKISDVKVDNVSVGAVTTYTFTNITANHTISATFTLLTYSLTSTAGTGGDISPAGVISVNYGTSQSYSIVAGTGYRISDVKVDNVSVGAVSSYSFSNIIANHTIAATFALIPFTITATSGANGVINPAGITTTNYGTDLTYKIVPDVGYKISDVKVDNKSLGPLPTYTFNNVTSNHTISASFTRITYTITGIAGSNGIISPSGIVILDYGTSQSYNIAANTGYQISDVKVDNVSVGPVSTYSINNVTADHTISAAFSPLTLTISVTAGEGGIISPEGATSIIHGSNETYLIVPDNGYRILDVVVDDVSFGDISSYIFNNVISDHKIAASFAPITYTITGNSGTGGKISPEGKEIIRKGMQKSYTITADSGYQISDVLVDNISVGAVSTYLFDNIDGDHTITANFSQVINYYRISAVAGSGGSVDPAGDIELAQGLAQTYKFTANSRYQISDVIIDNVSMGVLPGYTFNNIFADHTISVLFTLEGVREKLNPENIQVSVYPNPFKDKFTIKIDDPVDEFFNLSILNSSGKQIYYKTRLSSKEQIIFDEPLHEGIYFIELFNRSRKIVKMIIKN